MKKGLQKSVDEVYDAWKYQKAPRPDEGSGYGLWEIAPSEVVAEKTHSPLWIEYELSEQEQKDGYWPVKVRDPFTDLHAKAENYKPVGDSDALIKLYNKISGSEMWKNY